MHLKVFLKLKKPYKLSLLGKNIIKNPKTQKKTKKQNKPKKPTGLVFFKNPGFFQPCLGDGRVLALVFEGVRGEPAHHAHIAGVDDDALGPALHAEGGVEDEVVGEEGVLAGADGGAPLRLRLAGERGVVHLERDCLMR